MIWFTSDEHYGHENARLGWGRPEQVRPFSSLTDMRETLIANHNAVVGRRDVVWHLGDMFWRTLAAVDAAAIASRLNGRHHYVLGNHEEVMTSEPGSVVRARFSEIGQRAELRLPALKRPVVLDHYAGRVWNGSHRGSWQLHGHSHGLLPDAGLRQMDVGVDCNGFAPVSLERVRKFMEGR